MPENEAVKSFIAQSIKEKEEFEQAIRETAIFYSGIGIGGGGILLAATFTATILQPTGYWLGAFMGIFGIIFNVIGKAKPKSKGN